MEKLQLAFNNIYATMDMISDYKIKALGTMQQTVDLLSRETKKSQTYLDRVRNETVANAVGDIEIGTGGYTVVEDDDEIKI